MTRLECRQFIEDEIDVLKQPIVSTRELDNFGFTRSQMLKILGRLNTHIDRYYDQKYRNQFIEEVVDELMKIRHQQMIDLVEEMTSANVLLDPVDMPTKVVPVGSVAEEAFDEMKSTISRLPVSMGLDTDGEVRYRRIRRLLHNSQLGLVTGIRKLETLRRLKQAVAQVVTVAGPVDTDDLLDSDEEIDAGRVVITTTLESDINDFMKS